MMGKAAVYLHHKCYSSYVTEIINEVCQIYGIKVFEYNSRSFAKDKKGKYRNFSKEIGFKEGISIFRNANVNKGILDKDVKGFHIVRDPRDMLVSAAYSHKYTHPTGNWPGLERFRKEVKELSIGRVIRRELTFLGAFLDDMRGWGPMEWVSTIKAEELKSEDFIDIFKAAGMNVDLGLIELIMEKNSFENRTGRSVGEEDITSHYRSGRQGQWKDHFNKLIKYEFIKMYGKLISSYGYEKF